MPDERKEVADARVQSARAGLVGCLGSLEQRIVGAVDGVTGSVRETAGAIKNTVTGVIDEASGFYHRSADGMKEVLDVRQHINDYPWACVGAATFAGFISGFLAPRVPRNIVSRMSNFAAVGGSGHGGSSGNSLFGQLGDVLRRELKGLGETAILAATTALKNNVQELANEIHFAGGSDRRHRHNGIHAEVV
jgi:hypothetical protein